ncbi:MAG: aldolase [Bacteroidetes bacterium]|nr:MAG: aldolase [Bacteroidota bacterium]
MKYQEERTQTAAYMRRLYERHLTTCSGGNISCRVGENDVLLTASAIDKAYLQAEHIAILSMDGENRTPELKTSTESAMHLAVLKARPDVRAVVHAHPVHASLFTASDKTIRTDILAEARYMLGEPVMAPYARMGTDSLAEIVGKTFQDKTVNVVLLENHGIVTVGGNLHQAYDRMEVLEAAAHMTLLGSMLGGVKVLTPERRDEIDAMHG